MELGSNCPTIVFDDCDFEAAVKSCVSGAFWACGQNCIGVQRLYVQNRIYERFKKRFVKLTRSYKVGPKLDEDCDMGPLINENEACRVMDWISEAVSHGAKLLCGGKREGAVVTPAVLEGVKRRSRIAWDEVFGPAVCLYSFRTEEEAVVKANDVDYGLMAGVFTRDVNRALRVAEALDCGGVVINDSSDYRLDAMPFGGVKLSGLGREGVRFALQEMTEPKVVCFNR
jgi:glyceraldehyde-3-phosphate dehydrogenase (NADP+)